MRVLMDTAGRVFKTEEEAREYYGDRFESATLEWMQIYEPETLDREELIEGIEAELAAAKDRIAENRLAGDSATEKMSIVSEFHTTVAEMAERYEGDDADAVALIEGAATDLLDYVAAHLC